MSNLIPRAVIDGIREMVNISLDPYGIDCTLYIPNNIQTVETLDVYAKPSDYTFDTKTIKCFIEWPPNSIYKLKNYGMFAEGELPIIVYLPSKLNLGESTEEELNILRNSYIKVSLEYIPEDFQKYMEFELVDIIIRNIHDAAVVYAFKAVPRRV